MRALFLIAPLSLAALTGCGFVTGNALGVLFSEDGDLGLTDASVGGFWAGSGVVCLSSSDPSAVADAGLYTVRGRVVSDESVEEGSELGNLVPCDGDPGRVLTVETSAGETYQLGYAWRDPSGYDMTPWPSVDTGEVVNITVRQGESADTLAAGMAVTDSSGTLVYALEAGHGEAGLANGDIDGLVVRSDREISRMEDETCGQRVSLALDFSAAGSNLTLMEGEDNGMVIDEDYFTTCSIASHDIEDCEDSLGEVSWVLFR